MPDIEVTGTVGEKDGVLTIPGADGADAVKYVKESDLLAVKGSKESAESQAKEAVAARETAVADAVKTLDAEKSRALQAESKVETLEKQIAEGGGTAAQLEAAKAELATAKTSSEALATKHLELRRSIIVQAYGASQESVATKDLAALEIFEEALKVVIGEKKLGNFAAGAGGGGANALAGKLPHELAVAAYTK